MRLLKWIRRQRDPVIDPAVSERLTAIQEQAMTERDRTARLVTTLLCGPEAAVCPREISWEDFVGPEKKTDDA